MRGLYPAIDLADDIVDLSRFPLSGFVLGVPTPKRPDQADGALQLDRLIRALTGLDWACLLLAEPVAEAATMAQRNLVIKELRTVQAAAQAEKAPAPLASYYAELLTLAVKAFGSGIDVGMWRTGVYLLGNSTSYHTLASVWRQIFSGDESLPEPVRVFDSAETGQLAVDWALPDVPGSRGPGHYQHPVQFQTLLTSNQLAAYVHLPQLETCGFKVSTVPVFDSVPPSVEGAEVIALGTVVARSRETNTQYNIDVRDLTRHAFVAGVTGFGKTNTIFHLLEQAAARRVPFLVIEPAKAEYRSLLNHPALAGRLRVYTLGNERVSPFRLNPFEPVPGRPLDVHVDLLRAAFSAGFGMWTPLPQVLERSLYRVYEKRGWDIVHGTNRRVPLDAFAPHPDAFPTLSDLVTAVEDVTRELGYGDEKIKADIRAAMHTRLLSLRTGGKGLMLDTTRSLPMNELMEHPTILELEGMGDDNDKALLMGLLFSRIVEYRRGQPHANGLTHLLVIEEAHRSLANVAARAEGESNPRGEAVQTFAKLLAEIRAYGQGVIVADQIPLKLAPDVLKNTHLKIAHRVVSEDDRQVMAGAMAMDKWQMHALTILRPLEAAVFGEGDDAPVLVRMEYLKGDEKRERLDDARIAELMKAAVSSCEICGPAAVCVCATARDIVADPTVHQVIGRVVLSMIEDPSSLDRMWSDIEEVIAARVPAGINLADITRSVLVRAARWFIDRRGSQGAWDYSAAATLADTLARALLQKAGLARSDGDGAPALRRAFQEEALRLHRRTHVPYPMCEAVCNQQPSVCLYRSAVADLVASGRYEQPWRNADDTDLKSTDRRWRETWALCLDAAAELVEQPSSNAVSTRVAMCFEQQMLAADERRAPHIIRVIVKGVHAEATRGDGDAAEGSTKEAA